MQNLKLKNWLIFPEISKKKTRKLQILKIQFKRTKLN